jgi:hypothetical protein
MSHPLVFVHLKSFSSVRFLKKLKPSFWLQFDFSRWGFELVVNMVVGGYPKNIGRDLQTKVDFKL